MATIREVADKAGVSIATVSYVVNGTRYVSDELTNRVLQAMEELDYVPNQMARSLRGGGTRIIGFIAPGYATLYFAEIGAAIERAAASQGYSVIYCNSLRDLEKEKAYIDDLITKKVDGIIFCNIGQSDAEQVRLLRQGIPVVLMDWNLEGTKTDCILLNEWRGGRLAAEHLLSLGHRRIACIACCVENIPLLKRVEGFRQALKEGGAPLLDEYLVEGGYSVRSGKEAMRQLINLPNRPTAVFMTIDEMAIGALIATQEAGLVVPDDISLIGYDNVSLTAELFPPLTTVNKKIPVMCRKAVDMLIDRVGPGGSAESKREVIIEPSLIIRESTAPKRF